MDFYLGSIWVASRTDLTPVYVSLFQRLKSHDFDWVYHFPRLDLVDLRPLPRSSSSSEPEWLGYSPEKALAGQGREEPDAEIARMRESLEEAHQEAVEEARRPPPPTVRAYRAIFGGDPRGWPPLA